MKKLFSAILIIGLIIAAVFAWLILGSGTSFPENKKYLYIYTGKANEEEVMTNIKDNKLLDNPGMF